MNEQISRRDFLAAGVGGVSSMALLAGCGTAVQGLRAAVVPAAGRRPTSVRGLAHAIRGPVLFPRSPGFADAAHVFNERFDSVLPLAVARPLDAADVRAAVGWAVAHDVPLRARSGGHSYAGYSTLSGGVVLDLRNLSAVRFDRATGIATIGAGAQLIDIYAGLADHGVTIPGGSCPSVGIAGVTLGGGFGLAGRMFGLSADNLLGADIVTADGRIRNVDARTDPDLLWALRGGGGGNFGVVTRLHFRTHRVPSSAADFFVSWPASSAAEAFDAWQRWAPQARDELTSIFHLNPGPAPSVGGQYFGAASDLPGLLAPLTSVPGATLSFHSHDYLTLQLIWAGCLATGLRACHTAGTRPGGAMTRHDFYARSDYITRAIPSRGIQTLLEHAAQPGAGAVLFDSYGGAINRVAPHATAFVHRTALYCIQYYTEGSRSWLDGTYAAMRPYVSGQAYQNYIDRGLRTWRRAYYGDNYGRLVAVRKRVDPHHYFNFPQAIGS